MSRELRNATVVVGTDDLHDADGMMLMPDGQVKGAIDLTRHVTKVTTTQEDLPAPERCSAVSPESGTRCDLAAGHVDSHEAQTGPSSLVSWANVD